MNVCGMNECGMVGYISFYDGKDEIFNHDSALEIAFNDSDDNDDFMDEEMDNIFDYDNA